MVQALDLRKSGLQAVPLGLVLVAAVGVGDGILEGGVVGPEAEFGERWAPGEEVEYGADEGAVLGGELDARGGLDVGVFDIGGW